MVSNRNPNAAHGTRSEIMVVRGGGRDPHDVRVEREAVAFFVKTADSLGMPKSIACIYAVFFANAQPLSFADLTERLDLSQGSISQGLKVLKEIKAVRVVGVHDRREYFAPDMQLRQMAMQYIEGRLETQLVLAGESLKRIEHALPPGDERAIGEVCGRVRQLQHWHRKALTLMPMIKAFLKAS